MDSLKNILGNKDESKSDSQKSNESSSGGGGGGGFMDKINDAAGGGAQGEKNEDHLDKGNSSLLPLLSLFSALSRRPPFLQKQRRWNEIV